MKIAIVNDLRLAVEVLRRALAGVPELEVCWVAQDGAEAVRRCGEQRPDLILMDLLMPVMDGVEATRRIMAATPCPILVVTASVGGNFARVYEALGAGALDAVATPSFTSDGEIAGRTDLLLKIATLQTLTGAAKPAPWPPAEPAAARIRHGRLPPLLAIGASTGGPKALATLLAQLPADFPAAVVVVQHLDHHFVPGLADWLAQSSPLSVAPLTETGRLLAGHVWLAAADAHLVLDEHTLELRFSAEPSDVSCRPSVDVFFHSIARQTGLRGCGVLLTGMGRDGAAGLLALRRAGFYTIAQNEASSVVWGMPKAAVELDAADAVLPLGSIAERLLVRCCAPQGQATLAV